MEDYQETKNILQVLIGWGDKYAIPDIEIYHNYKINFEGINQSNNFDLKCLHKWEDKFWDDKSFKTS